MGMLIAVAFLATGTIGLRLLYRLVVKPDHVDEMSMLVMSTSLTLAMLAGTTMCGLYGASWWGLSLTLALTLVVTQMYRFNERSRARQRQTTR